ncbi:aminodeoxychorismate synthase component I [Pseudomonas sp. NPDC086581]|uniref:aminodeoxychorismate synthase component I n=1 Tax=Pseudomonas sp. NPDC086581 TaxID=3364432 RepID=UPI0038120C5B
MPDCFLHPLPYQEDPGERFALIHRAPGAVLLDAGRPIATRGRYDLLSAWPLAELAPTADESAKRFFARARAALQSLGEAKVPDNHQLPFVGGMIGYLGYDFGRRVEHLPVPNLDDLALPDARLGLYAWALITDHEKLSSQLVFHPSLATSERERLIALFENASDDEALTPFQLSAPFRPDLSREQYREALERVHRYILAGDCYQVNYTQRFRAPCNGSSWSAYRALREACPTPFAGYMALPEGAVLSLSPERFIQLHGKQVETRPIKGTRPRGDTPEADQANADALLASEKDRAENLMIVDLLRNDLGRSCRPGSVRVPELFAVETYPNVHHLVSSVRGELADGKDAFDLLEGSFPGGSITGAPKVRAMQIIDELEPTQRSIYCGSLLYLDVRGEMDSSIAIRTVLVKDGHASCWAGGGIVADSNWEEEYEESLTKVGVLLRTLEGL